MNHVVDLRRDLDGALASGRWTPRRKYAAVQMVAGGHMTAADVCAKYRVEPDELVNWARRYRLFGFTGLSSDKLQKTGR